MGFKISGETAAIVAAHLTQAHVAAHIAAQREPLDPENDIQSIFGEYLANMADAAKGDGFMVEIS